MGLCSMDGGWQQLRWLNGWKRIGAHYWMAGGHAHLVIVLAARGLDASLVGCRTVEGAAVLRTADVERRRDAVYSKGKRIICLTV